MKVGYARVSTSDQCVDLQVSALRAAGCLTIFEDFAVSGASTARPGLSKALGSLRSGDSLVVWKLDRLGRSLVHLVATVHDLAARGVEFCSLTESIDTSSPGGRLVFHIMAALAEFERSLISERTRAGMIEARIQGRSIGRPPSLSVPQQLEAIRAIALEGEAIDVVARRYQVHARTIHRILQRVSLEGPPGLVR